MGGLPAIEKRVDLPSANYTFSIWSDTGVPWVTTSRTGENSVYFLSNGDAAVLDAQKWLDEYFTVAASVGEMVGRFGLAERRFKLSFKKAAGYSPIAYVQHVRIEEAKCRLWVPILFYLPGQMMNAFTVGTREEAAIGVSDGLLRRLNGREISAVLAHEVSHIRHNDIRMMDFANLSNVIVQMLSVFGQFLLILNFPMLLIGQYTISWTAIGLLIFAPSISTMLQLALSRTREYNADLGAAELLGDSEALASALAKMDNYHIQLFRNILWPGYTRKAGSTLFRTHPPTKERIRRLLEIRNQRPKSITDGIVKPRDNRYRRTIWHHPAIQSPWF
jgi:Zn-dependent protease with chaperone function